MLKPITIILCVIAYISMSKAQSSAEILQELERFKSPYRILYLAAHPDDENTRLISYFTGELRARTAYLSLTRGSGGQNLIGTEKGPLLGLLRTEELMSARRIDGAEQFFTRAMDFGYSKTFEESFGFWNKDSVLKDAIYIARWFKPHIVVNRFPENNYNGHGHHQASAIVSAELYKNSGRADVYPAMATKLGTWNIGSVYQNSSTWWDKNLPERAKNDELIKVLNVGQYNALMGYSYNELSAKSRSQHKSQGFGAAPSRGEQFEYLEHLYGLSDRQLLTESLLDSIDKTWLQIAPLVDSIALNWKLSDPGASVAELLRLRRKTLELNAGHHRFDNKVVEINEIIASCLGISLEMLSEQDQYTRGQKMRIVANAINRGHTRVGLLSIEIGGELHSWNRTLPQNIVFTDTIQYEVDSTQAYTNPYWLDEDFKNTYQFKSELLPYANARYNNLKSKISLLIADDTLIFNRDVEYHWTDRVKGALSHPIRVIPKFTLAFDQAIYFLKDSLIQGNVVLINHFDQNGSGDLVLTDLDGNEVFRKSIKFEDSEPAINIAFSYKPTGKASEKITLSSSFQTSEGNFNHQIYKLDYDHIEKQMALLPAFSKAVVVNFPQSDKKIAYVSGPDNELLQQLKSIGLNIEEITKKDVVNGNLNTYDVLLFGIRSINVDPEWDKLDQQIQEFTKKGGLTIVQYQTSRRINPLKMAPYPFEISRKRVTDETANTKILRAEHPIMLSPFKLESKDFEQWNQERGLYFADKRSEEYVSLLSWHDKDEMDEFGGLIIGDFGKGSFIYTGISFFRHIPAGVPGSYKLLYNILNYQP